MSSWLRFALPTAAALLVLLAGDIALRVASPPPISALGWPVAAASRDPGERVTVTWLGLSTLLFDDGETQLLTDGTFTRPAMHSLLTGERLRSDLPTINHALAEFRLDRLAAIVPLSSRFDQAMDAGQVANRTGAVVLGSESTANVARGAGVPTRQFQVLADGEVRRFGNFSISLFALPPPPERPDDEAWFGGRITEPLEQPAPLSGWKTGIHWAALIEHREGNVLVVGSPGHAPGAIPRGSAEVVLPVVAGIAGMGRHFALQWWRDTVLQAGATRVLPVHYDDWTRPFGETVLFPALIDDLPLTASWLESFSGAGTSPVTIERLPFGRPVPLFGGVP